MRTWIASELILVRFQVLIWLLFQGLDGYIALVFLRIDNTSIYFFSSPTLLVRLNPSKTARNSQNVYICQNRLKTSPNAAERLLAAIYLLC